MKVPRKPTRVVLCMWLWLTLLTQMLSEAKESAPLVPSIADQLKPAVWKRVLQEREVMSYASLDELSGMDLKKYSFYASMLVKASIAQSRQVLTDYKVYAELIPYVDKAQYSSQDHTLLIEGGIWKYQLQSMIRFEEKSDRWIHYQVIRGSFEGLSGDIFFESQGEKGTAILFKGEQTGKKWPPQFVIERGAEIVFGFTAKRMRSYIEAQKKIDKGEGHEQQGQPNGKEKHEVPKPRSHL